MSVLPQQDPALEDDLALRQASEPYRATAPGASRPRANEAAIQDPHHLLPAHAVEAPRKGSPLRLVVVVLLLLLATAFVVWRIRGNKREATAQANRAAAAANRPIPVQVAVVQQRTVPVFLTALGTVTPYNTVTLHSRVDGQLLRVNFTEGQVVRKGQLLMEVDPRPYQATLDQALGALARDEANLKNQEAQAQRYTALYQAGVVSKESQQLQVSNSGQAAGTIKADQAAIEAARVNLGYTRIYSPIDGVVGLRQVDPGNIVHASDAGGLVVITQVHPIAIIFTLPEDQLPSVQQAMRSGPPLVVEAYDRSDAHRIASGKLLTIDNQIDTTTGTAKLKAIFDNPDGGLFPNQFVNVRLVLRDRPNAIVVPTAAIENGNQGDYVFVVNPGPTPPDKRRNAPGAQPGEGEPGASGPSAAGGRGGPGGQPDHARAPFHADQVPVHVDFTIGTVSILAQGAVHGGQQVVVDGQEKLVDGGNVNPQRARTIPAGNNGAVGLGSSAPSTQPAQGVNPRTGSRGRAGRPSAPAGAGR